MTEATLKVTAAATCQPAWVMPETTTRITKTGISTRRTAVSPFAALTTGTRPEWTTAVGSVPLLTAGRDQRYRYGHQVHAVRTGDHRPDQIARAQRTWVD